MTEKAAFCKLMGTLVASSVSSWATQPVQWGSTISDGFRIFRFHIESAWKNFGGMPSPTLAITGGSSNIVQCDIMRHSLWQKHLKSTNPCTRSPSFAIAFAIFKRGSGQLLQLPDAEKQVARCWDLFFRLLCRPRKDSEKTKRAD